MFKRVVSGRWPLAHLAGGGALIVLALASDVFSPLPYAGCAVLILLGSRSRTPFLRVGM